MSFFSSINYVRSGKPPRVTVQQLTGMVQQALASGALENKGLFSCKLRYGRAVDIDDRDTVIVDYDETGIIGTCRPYPWDISEKCSSLEEGLAVLSRSDGSIYRAYIGLGNLTHEIIKALGRMPSEENNEELCLDGASLSVGPKRAGSLTSESAFFAGWISLSFSGPGYFYPRTYSEAIVIAKSIPEIRALTNSCRKIWPASLAAPSRQEVINREKNREIWMRDSFNLPHDWYWHASET